MPRLRLPPTATDQIVAHAIERRATPNVERRCEAATLLADEKLLLIIVGACWASARLTNSRFRRPSDRIAASFLVSWLLPHLLKGVVAQERPDRREVHGRRRGIPKSGNAFDAFPSGHAMHVGALAAGLSAIFPRHRQLIWATGLGLAGTRVILLAHWLSDVLAGLTIGVMIDLLVGRSSGR
jgi:undecaprenyl-diphosphatase